MTLAQAIAAVETHEFAARIGVASDWAGLVAALDAEPAVAVLMGDPANARSLGDRVLELANTEVDHRYEHPFDAALTAYLVVLSRLSKPIAEVAAAAALRVNQLWWAAKVARQTLLESNVTTTTEAHSVAPGSAQSLSTRSQNSDETILVLPFFVRRSARISNGNARPFAHGSSASERVYGGALVLSTRNSARA